MVFVDQCSQIWDLVPIGTRLPKKSQLLSHVPETLTARSQPKYHIPDQYHAISEGKIRHLGPENKIGIFFGTISGLWSQLVALLLVVGHIFKALAPLTVSPARNLNV